MKQVRYSEIADGEIFMTYSCNHRKSVSIYEKISYNYHKQLISWQIEKFNGNLYVDEQTNVVTSLFILKADQSIEQLVTCFKLTDKELQNLAIEFI